MPSEVIRLPGGAAAIVKRPAPRPRRCSVCRAKVHNFVLCDFVERAARENAAQPVTCDKVLCWSCAVHVEPDTDYCPLHAAALQVGGRRLRL